MEFQREHVEGPSTNRQSRIRKHLQSLSSDVQIAAEAAELAGCAIRDGWDTALTSTAKGAGDIVTEVDEYANRLISKWLPSVMIARETEGVITASVVHFPLTGDWFYAEKGKGAFKNGSRLECNKKPPFESSRAVLNQYSDSQYETRSFLQVSRGLRSPKARVGLVTVEPPHSGAACQVADQFSPVVAVVHDNNLLKRKQEIWDVAAPSLIVREAGGVFWNSTGEDYDIRETDLIVCAATKEIGNRILSCLE